MAWHGGKIPSLPLPGKVGLPGADRPARWQYGSVGSRVLRRRSADDGDRKMQLPYRTPLPGDPRKRRTAVLLRVAAYVAFTAAVGIPVWHFTHDTISNAREVAEFDRKTAAATSATATGDLPKRPKEHKGAIGRWCAAVKPFWAGENIYRSHEQREAADSDSRVMLHPNMPFIVILLSPLAYLPPALMALIWSLLKVAALAVSLLMTARLAADGDRRIPDWVLALGLLWSMLTITDDVLHGNTNVFVLAAVAGHLWLFRRGSDRLSGLALALAICLKMTPAIFLLYWLHQRCWKLLGWAAAGLVLMAAVIPAVAVGPARSAELTQSWLENLVVPGLVKGAWYPIHVNQSLPGVFSRYLLPRDDPNGNIFWNPDDNPYDRQTQFGWISVAGLSEGAVRWLIRLCQLAVLVAAGWAIGRGKLPRADGRRALHYGLVVAAMLLMNQRTWEHHGPVLLVAWVAIWQAIAFGLLPRGGRPVALGLALLSGAVFWLTRSDLVGSLARAIGQTKQEAEITADVVSAYGPFFCHVLLLFVAGVLLSAALRTRRTAYGENRQGLLEYSRRHAAQAKAT